MTPFDHALACYLEALSVTGYSASTVDGRRSTLAAFIAWCGERGIGEPSAVTPAAVSRYQRHLYHYREPDGLRPGRGRGRKPGQPLTLATQRNRLTALKVFCRWLVRERWIAYNPASELDLPRVPPRLPGAILTAAEIERVLRHTAIFGDRGVRDRAVIETLYATGIRRMELAQLRLYDVDALSRTLIVRQGKGGKGRVLPIHAHALHWIDRYLVEIRPGLLIDANETTLFLNDHGQSFRGGQLTEKIKDYFLACGIDKPGACHLFRHTMATRMLENGADLRYIQDMLGHADISTTTLYTRVSISALRTVYERTHPGRSMPPRDADADPATALLAALAIEAQDD
jgi:integrase/recombinase XerD